MAIDAINARSSRFPRIGGLQAQTAKPRPTASILTERYVFKMLSSKKKILSIILALVLAFSTFGATAFAAPGDDLDAYYVQEKIEPTVAGQFTLSLYIDTSILYPPSQGAYFDIDALPVTLGTPSSPATTYYVSDVLVAAMRTYPQLAFLSGGVPITPTTNYLETVEITSGGTVYSYSPATTVNYYNGWMFRINDKFPLMAGTSPDDPYGVGIAQAYVVGGDEVFLYFADMTENLATATYFPRFERTSYDAAAGELTAVIYASNSYYSNAGPWVINPFAPFVNQQSLTIAIDGVDYPAVTDGGGMLTITGLSLATGTHNIVLRPQFINYFSDGVGIPFSISANTEITV